MFAMFGFGPSMFGRTGTRLWGPSLYMADQTLDVRDVDGQPFDDIMTALETLEDAETLELVNSFEPEPLYPVLDQRGFNHEAEQVDEDEWRLRIEHA